MNDLKLGFKLSLKGIKKDKAIFIFTALIITFGFINVFFFTSFLAGMSQTLNDQLISKQWGNVIITPKENSEFINFPDRILNKVRRVPGILGATKRLRLNVILENKEGDKIVAPWYFQGIVPKDERKVTNLQDTLIQGAYLGDNDINTVMISNELVGQKGGLLLPREDTLEANVGDQIIAKFDNGIIKNYKLKGVVSPRDIYAVISGYITFKQAETVLGISNKASYILIKTPLGKEDQFVRTFQKLGINEKILTWKDKAMTTKVITDSFEIINQIFKIVGLFIIFITVIIISYINILNNKKRIGILKAIGINEKTIIFTYLGNSLIYGGLGVFLGSILTFFLFVIMQKNPLSGPLGDMAPIFNLNVYLISIVLILIFSLIGALIPSMRVVKKNIIDLIGG